MTSASSQGITGDKRFWSSPFDYNKQGDTQSELKSSDEMEKETCTLGWKLVRNDKINKETCSGSWKSLRNGRSFSLPSVIRMMVPPV